MTLYLLKAIRLFFLPLLLVNGLFAQTIPVLINDLNHRAEIRPDRAPIQSRMDGPDTLIFSTAQPFFDDFSSENTRPDASLWYDPKMEDRGIPDRTRNAAINPPSRGSLQFDGRNSDGSPYEIRSLAFGKADLLLSHYIDLRGFTASSNIHLSFYLQAGGRGESPEATDSFRVAFLTPSDTFLVYSRAGGNEDFQYVSIPVNRVQWFVEEFQIAFENKGSLNGAIDVWHLDYVYMAPNRNGSTLGLNDQSAVGLISSPFAPFSAMPLKHFQLSGGNSRMFDAELSNVGNNNGNLSVNAELSETFLNTPLSPPFSQTENLNLGAGSNNTLNFSPFASQNLSAPSVLELEINSNSSDDRLENNAFREKFRVDSILAYDDGEADMGLGLNRPLGMGIEVNLDEADSVSAVWISFVPTLNFNPVNNAIDYMEGRSFRFRIWSFPHPDSILYEQVNDMKVTYGDEANTYVRFPLNRNVAVDGTFWLGVQQLNTLPIGVGYDLSYDNDNKCYYDSSGVWTNFNLGGSLMIRPEFFNTNEVVLSSRDNLKSSIRLYPNPVNTQKIYLNISPTSDIISYKACLMDLKGSLIQEYSSFELYSGEIQFDIPENVQAGLYIWQHIVKKASGEQLLYPEKLLIGNKN
ncbi:MAG: hypothetical protein AAFR87_04510 [Bacteroidota bacterium]